MAAPERSDAELVQAYCQGDRQAMTALAERYHRRLAGFLLHTVGNMDDALDIAQNVWHRVLRTIANYRPEDGEFFTWLTYQAYSCRSDFLRRRRAQRAVPIAEALDSFEKESDDGGDPAARLLLAEDCESLHAWLGKLSVASRQLLEMRFLAELSRKQVADLLKIPIGTVDSRQSAAMAELRQVVATARPREGVTHG